MGVDGTASSAERRGGWYGKLDGAAWRDVVEGTKLGVAARRGGHCGEIGVAVKEQQRGLDRDESLGQS